MASGEQNADQRIVISEGLRQIREAIAQLREDAVQAVKRRNTLSDELARLDRELADLEIKTGLAERLKDASLAAEIRGLSVQRKSERDRVSVALNAAVAKAEAAKVQLPEEEAALLRQTAELKSQLASLSSERAISATTGQQSNADEMWDRATSKIRDLGREAAAREEIASMTGPSSANISTASVDTSQKSAEQMLAELEARLGIIDDPALEIKIRRRQ